MLPGVSLKVTLGRKLIAMVHFQGSEGGTVRVALNLGQYSTGIRENWFHSSEYQDSKALCAKNVANCDLGVHSERSEQGVHS